ncbi:MAG: glycosyltransferase family 39 protein [Cyanobacteria bacterium]|nr:glycosyltransferase family 39 protein [Cyanobacteriota bacterium]
MSLRYLSWPCVAALLAALSLLLHAPLLQHIDSAIASDLGDPLLNTWILWWNTQQVPLTDAYWNAPAFAPAPNALALSETLLGLTWLTTPLQWMGLSPLVAYNVLFIVKPVLNGLAAYWLCWVLTARRDAAFIGALALAFAPYHAAQMAHVQTTAVFFIPIALGALHRYWSSSDRRWLALLTGALAMNGLVSGYLLLYFAVFLGVAILWLAISSRDRRKTLHVVAATAAAAILLLPVMLRYGEVRREFHLGRPITEVERLSADVSSIALGSDRLSLWPIAAPLHRGEIAGYPGVAIVILLLAAAIAAAGSVSWRRRRIGVSTGLVTLATLAIAVGVIAVDRPYKVIGVGLDLVIIGLLCSREFVRSIRSGSLPILYTIGAIISFVIALGPVGKVLGHRFWYKAPFAWLMELPPFEFARVPARFAAIEIVCLAALAAFAVVRLWPNATRASLVATFVIAAAIVADGWAHIPVHSVPQPVPVPLTADLVVELPMHGPFEDVRAMYDGIAHRRPVVNGYSGFEPPHYAKLRDDLMKECVAALETIRDGRSMDAVIWRADGEAPMMVEGLKLLWPEAVREETPVGLIRFSGRFSYAV